MPTATPFTALGAGDGFASCLEKVDVSSYDYWTTFSGVNKDSPVTSDLLIAESIQLGMKLYWNGFSCVAPTDSAYTAPTGSTASAVSYLDVSLHSKAEPKDRVCGIARASEEDNNGTSYAQLYINRGGFVKMYDGAITDESRFVGVGYSNVSHILSRGSASNRATTNLSIIGYTDDSGYGAASPYNESSYAYVTIGGLDFVCRAYARAVETIATRSADATNLTASANAELSSRTFSSTSTITSIDFYDY